VWWWCMCGRGWWGGGGGESFKTNACIWFMKETIFTKIETNFYMRAFVFKQTNLTLVRLYSFQFIFYDCYACFFVLCEYCIGTFSKGYEL